MSHNLAAYDTTDKATNGADLWLVNPADKTETLPFVVTIIGRDSEEFEDWMIERGAEQAEEERIRSMRGQQVDSQKEQIERFMRNQREEAIFAARAFKQCTNFDAYKKGAKPEFKQGWDFGAEQATIDRKADILARPGFKWVVQQIGAGLDKRALFMPDSGSN